MASSLSCYQYRNRSVHSTHSDSKSDSSCTYKSYLSGVLNPTKTRQVDCLKFKTVGSAGAVSTEKPNPCPLLRQPNRSQSCDVKALARKFEDKSRSTLTESHLISKQRYKRTNTISGEICEDFSQSVNTDSQTEQPKVLSRSSSLIKSTRQTNRSHGISGQQSSYLLKSDPLRYSTVKPSRMKLHYATSCPIGHDSTVQKAARPPSPVSPISSETLPAELASQALSPNFSKSVRANLTKYSSMPALDSTANSSGSFQRDKQCAEHRVDSPYSIFSEDMDELTNCNIDMFTIRKPRSNLRSTSYYELKERLSGDNHPLRAKTVASNRLWLNNVSNKAGWSCTKGQVQTLKSRFERSLSTSSLAIPHREPPLAPPLPERYSSSSRCSQLKNQHKAGL